MKRLAVLLCTAACGGAGAPGPGEPAASLDVAALDAFVDRELAPHLPALAVGVIRPDGLVWHRAAGARDGRGGAPPDRRSVFRIGSVTKLFTGIAIMQLRDRAVLELEDPARRWVPELPPALASVTVHHLVTHTSGIPTLGDGSAPYWETRGPSEAAMLGALDLPLEFAPGSASAYSNAGVALVGTIVARASSRPYRDYVTEHITTPLGMTSTRWDRGAVADDVRVTGRGEDGTIDPPTWELGAFEAAGGMWASLDDMAAFARFALVGDERVLSHATRERMMTDDPLPGRYGIAWVTVRHPRVGRLAAHTGSTTDYAASIVVLPEHGLATVVLASSGAAELVDCAAVAIAVGAATRTAPASCARFVAP